jgi:ethanolamine ammonia-lyase large subunit
LNTTCCTRIPHNTPTQHHHRQADDKRAGDRFGLSLALDGETLLVGAQASSAVGVTTWDFETGDLSGWTASGTAFANQPTYGDNSYG